MYPFPSIMLSSGRFIGFSTTYTSAGSQLVAVPYGARNVVIEGYGGGASANTGSTYTGAGAAYAKKNSMSTSGVTAIYITVSALQGDTGARLNSSTGTVIMLAKGATGKTAAAANTCIGDVVNIGGNGYTTTSLPGGGGGAGGPISNGTSGTSSSSGAGGGGLAGYGGSNAGGNGNNYGGGGGGGTSNNDGKGAGGALVLTWS